MSDKTVGRFCLVLHTHLPWLLHHGSWPVGEEWLYQSWAHSYLPVIDVLTRLGNEGYRDLLTLGVTPIVNDQLDDSYALREFGTWLAFWQLRAQYAATRPETHVREAAAREYRAAQWSLDQLAGPWSGGASPLLRALSDSGVVELLGGPAAHPFQPLLREPIADFSLRTGLDDATVRWGHRPRGIWAPECGYRPGLESLYADAGVSHFMVDGPTLQGVGASPADAWTIAGSDVVAFGRDLEVAYRVWSPKSGYPGKQWYRDFHTFDHPTGLRPMRVTSKRTPSELKKPYDEERAAIAAREDAVDFVNLVRNRLIDLADQRGGKPATVIAAYDTELFGHWWHEGPVWLEHVLRLLPEAGIEVTTFAGAIESGAVAGDVAPEPGSWGSGKDWRVWAGPQVADVVKMHDDLQDRFLSIAESRREQRSGYGRDAIVDQLARQTLLALSSDWAFMVSKDSAAGYARDRAHGHLSDFARIADPLAAGNEAAALVEVVRQRSYDNPLGHLRFN
jgi:1,4-alpha-glucan branching enzyme